MSSGGNSSSSISRVIRAVSRAFSLSRTVVNEVLGDVRTGETLSALFDALKVLDASNMAEWHVAEAG